MAELSKKLHFKKGTTEHLAKAYSTTAEAGAEYITNKIDGVTAYIPIGATNDSRATMSRITKNGTKAILNSGRVPYNKQQWTTPGIYTFTVPLGVTRVKATCVGGGGGGVARTKKAASDSGESSYFGSVTAQGGIGVSLEWQGRIFNINAIIYRFPQGGIPNGHDGELQSLGSIESITPANTQYTSVEKDVWCYGGEGFALSTTKSKGDYGRGGNVYNWDKVGVYGSGGSGGYAQRTINVTAGQTIALRVGNRGSYKGGDADGVNTAASAQATSGFVIVEYGGDI